MTRVALALRGVTRRFPGVLANDHVDLEVHAGTIHALVGENGAGKTTLMRIAAGELQADAGEVDLFGQPLGRGGAARALELGLGMVHQHFMLVPTLDVASNVVLGAEPRRGPWLDTAAAAATVRRTAEVLGMDVDPGATVESLSVGEQQRVEILKVLSRDVGVLVLDEPTAVLAPGEVTELFAVLRRLASRGTAIVLISHRLQEVLAIADRITVLRGGRVVGAFDRGEASEAELARCIVGREIEPLEVPRVATPQAVALACRDVHTGHARAALRGLTLDVRAGEIVGVAGVEGNGQTALVEAILGVARLAAGALMLCGEDVTQQPPWERRRRGLACVPADRLQEALVPAMRVDENAILGRQREPAWGRGPWLSAARVARHAAALLRRFDVRPSRVELPVAALSGGNQQRLVLGRELERDPHVLLLAQPTRGVDIGGARFIHRQILQQRDAGKAVLLLSADLGEILALADRIAVIFAGRIVATVDRDRADPIELGLWMTRGAGDGAPGGAA